MVISGNLVILARKPLPPPSDRAGSIINPVVVYRSLGMKEESRLITLEDCRKVVDLDSIVCMLQYKEGISIEKAREIVYSLDEKEIESELEKAAWMLFEEILIGVKVVQETENFLFLDFDLTIEVAGGWDKFNALLEECGMKNRIFTEEGSGYFMMPKKRMLSG
jgi:hypothetical protein